MMRGAITGTLILILLAGCTSMNDGHYDVTGQRKDPAEVNTQLGIAYMRKGMYDTSLEKLNKAIRQNPDFQLAQVSIRIERASVKPGAK